MQNRRKILIVLCVYLSLIIFTPVIHYLSEGSKNDCENCYTGAQLNSLCNNRQGPCNNPKHHHHNSHKHDPAHCTFCKLLIKDIEYVTIYYGISFDNFTLVFQNIHRHSSTFLRRTSIRAPPLNSFLT